jgi:hypothetical protein
LNLVRFNLFNPINQVNFTTALPDANYSVALGGSQDSFQNSASYGIGMYQPATDSFYLACRTESNTYADYLLVTAVILR